MVFANKTERAQQDGYLGDIKAFTPVLFTLTFRATFCPIPRKLADYSHSASN